MFKRNGRREDPVAPPVAAAAAADALTTSKVLPRFLAALAHQPAPVILDLGPVVGANIAFFGERLSCKIHVEDVFADVERLAQLGDRAGLGACVATRLTQVPATIDGILCWDLFDFLDKPTGQALARKLAGLLRPGGALYGCFGTTPIELHHYTRSFIESADTLRQRPYAATPVRRTVLLTRDIIKMFDGLVVAESVLLKSSTRETLFRRP